MGRERLLVKKWRVEEVWLCDLEVCAGIYVDPQKGGFYALVPEQERREGGTLFRDESRTRLASTVREALREHYALEWRQAILVDYPHPMGWGGDVVGGSRSGRGHRWSPNDPTTASDVLGPLDFDHVEIAEGPNGYLYRDILTEEQARRGRKARIRRMGAGDLASRGVVELPYTPETWAALVEFKRRLQQMDHAIRTLLQSDDVLPRLLAMTGAPLLTAAPAPEGGRDG